MSQILIKDGMIYDGTGSKPFKADILVSGEKILEIGKPVSGEDCDVINAEGCAVSPGFIDTHTHADMSIFYDRQHSCSLLQGVTTEIVGMCGLGLTPLNSEQFDNYVKYSAGIFDNIPGFHPDFSTVDKYLSAIVCGNNIAYSATHSAVRIAAAGFQNVPLKGDLLEKAKKALRTSLEDGAVGFSTGLSYFPHYYSDTDELIELCSVAAEYDVPFLVHHRTVFANNIKQFDPTWEAMEVAKRTKVKLHILHTKTSWPDTAGNIKKRFEPYYSKAKEDGVDISFELYPYNAGSGYAVAFLPWRYTEGGYYETMKRLGDQQTSDKIVNELSKVLNEIMGDSTLVFTHLKNNVEYVGHSFEEVSRQIGLSLPKMIIKVLYENDLEVGFRGSESDDDEVNRILNKDIMELLTWPNYMVGSDSIPLGEKPNPRAFGSFAKILRMTREMGYPLEMIINRITKLPVSRYKLGKRGELKAGMLADIVVFDPLKVVDTATWDTPRSAPIGIPYVLVNGKIAVRNEKPTGLLAGRGLRRDKI